ncbi:MAG: NPCBM/NEW2 domain-containing protein [Planctomycetota bacterium]
MPLHPTACSQLQGFGRQPAPAANSGRRCPGATPALLLSCLAVLIGLMAQFMAQPLAAGEEPGAAAGTSLATTGGAPTPAAPAAAAKGDGFQPNTVLADGSEVGPLWPSAQAVGAAPAPWVDATGKTAPAGNIVRVLLSSTPPPAGVAQSATTFDGQRILGSIDAFSEKEGLKIVSPDLGPVQIPAALLSRLYVQPVAASEADDEDLPPGLETPGAAPAASPRQKDLTVYRNADQAESRLFFLSDGIAKLKSGDDFFTAPMERLSYLTLAAPAQLPATTAQLLVLLTDGTRVTGNVVAVRPKQLVLKSSLGTLTIDRTMIHSLWPHEAGYRFLARERPTALKNFGQFDVHFAPRYNRTADGKPIDTAEFNFAGIGMHSYTRAEYALQGAGRFAAYVTLDRSAPAAAQTTVRVYLDGEKKLELDLNRNEPGRWIALPTAGAKTIALEVDFGPDHSDAGDLVDWINPVLLQ